MKADLFRRWGGRGSLKTGPRAFLIACLLVLASAGSRPSEAAVSGGSLAISLDKKSSMAAATVDYVFQQSAAQSTRIRALSLIDIAEGEESKKRKRAVEQAQQALQAGWVAYQNLEFEGAISSLNEAIELFKQTDLAHEMPGLLRALSLSGVTHFFSGDLRKARSALTRLLSIRPDFVFDSEIFSPDVLELAESIRTSVQKDQNFTLEVRVAPSHARIYLDGVFQGLSPQEIKKLAPAEHYLTVVAPGYALEQSVVRAGPGAMAKITLAPASQSEVYNEHVAALMAGFQQGDVSQAAAAMARWASLDEILIGGVAALGDKKVRVVALRVAKDGHILGNAQRDLDLGSRAALGEAGALARALFAADLPRGPSGEAISTQVRMNTPFGMRSWSYISFGVGAGALTVGSIFAIQASRAAKDARAIPQVERALVASALSKARTRAAIADTFFGLAFAAAGAGAYLIMPRGGTAQAPNPIDSDSGQEDPFAFAPVVWPDGGGVLVVGRF